MILTLPRESFVPVSSCKLAAPTVAWVDGERFSNELAAENAFCIPQSYEPSEAYGAEVRTQLSDRYGGIGVGYAGGSGRCSTSGNLQIKGVGPTPLVTPRHDPFHTSGTATLHEAGREVIWSQILSAALPYGVVPPLAIVLTNSTFVGRNPEGIEVPWQRALLMREFALRPAHYLRNIYFKTPGSAIEGLFEDACRSRAAINMLHQGFEHAFGKQVTGAKGIEKINLGLRIMAKRFAAQVAASFAKRIFHGALCCSNIALDGRFLDFGVMTFVEAYRRLGKIGLDPWTQHGAVLRTMRLLRFHLQKYLHLGNANGLISEAELVAEFNTELASRQEIEMLKMTGVPEEVISIYPVGDRRRLSRCLRNICSSGASEVFTIWHAQPSTAGSNPQARDGRFNLNKILALAGACPDVRDLDRTLMESLSDTCLRKEFVEGYGNFVEWFVSRFDQHSQHAARVYVALQAVRLNSDISFLIRETLNEKMTIFNENPEGIGDFIDETIARGKYFLQQDHPDLLGGDARSQIDSLHGNAELCNRFCNAEGSASSLFPQSTAEMKMLFESNRI